MHKKNTALIFYYSPANKYSIHALVGAVEKAGDQAGIYLLEPGAAFLPALQAVCSEYARAIVCFSFFTTQVWEIGTVLKALAPGRCRGLVLVAGGPHPAGDPQGTLAMGFDLVVLHEGEEVITEIIRRVKNGEELHMIPGTAYRGADGKPVMVRGRKRIALDDYSAFSLLLKCYGPVEITRGCPYCCKYCQTPYITGTGGMRHRSITSICREVSKLVRVGIKDIQFITPNALCYGSADGKTVNMGELELLLKSVRRLAGSTHQVLFGSFPSEVRPEHVTPEIMELLACYTDNRRLVIGCQSGSERILAMCSRGHTVADIYRAVELAAGMGFKPDVDFIFGLPGETGQDIRETAKVMQDLAALGARIHAHTFMPLPGTPFAHAPFTGLSSAARGTIHALLGKGSIFGQWEKQEQLARRIVEWYAERIKEGI